MKRLVKKVWRRIVDFLMIPLRIGWALGGYSILFITVLVAFVQSEDTQQDLASTSENLCEALNETFKRGNAKWDYVIRYFLEQDPGNEIVLNLAVGMKNELNNEPIECTIPIKKESDEKDN